MHGMHRPPDSEACVLRRRVRPGGARSGRRGARCRNVTPMRRKAWWLLLVGGAITVIGVLIQAFTIAAYVRGAGQGALDAHGGFSTVAHVGQLLILVGTIWAFWRNWGWVAAAA